jgi:hypothetical protein
LPIAVNRRHASRALHSAANQRWKLPMISPVSGVGLRVFSSISTVTDWADATHLRSENTT